MTRAERPRAEPKDRWHQLDDAIDVSGLPASDRAVFRALLKRANWQTADLPLKFTPTRPQLRRATGLSLRQVHYSVEHLERHGWLAVKHGHRAEYALSAGFGCDCRGRVHVAPAGQERVQPQERERVQRDEELGATIAPSLVQPLGATPQVRPGAVLRGTEREEERVPEREPEEPEAWTAEQLAAGREFARSMEAHGSDPWR